MKSIDQRDSYRCREIYHGNCWMNDSRFSTPMISCHVGHLFINDFIKCKLKNGDYTTAKVISFLQKVG